MIQPLIASLPPEMRGRLASAALGLSSSKIQSKLEIGLEMVSTRVRARASSWLDFEARFWPSILWPPTIGAGGLLALAAAGSTFARWAALPAAPIAVGLVWLIERADRGKPGAWLIRALGYPGACWLAGAWWWGPQVTPALLSLAGLWILATALWLAHVRGWLGSRPAPAPKLDRLAEVFAQWTAHAASLDLRGVQAGGPREEGGEIRVPLVLDSAHTFRDVNARVERLEVTLQVREGAVRVVKGQLAHQCELRIVRRDPWDSWKSYPGPSGDTFAEPIAPAYRASGEPVLLALADQDALLMGVKGSGKSRKVVVWIIEYAFRRDVLLYGMDVAKRGIEFLPLHPLFWRLAIDERGAEDVVHELHRIQEIRARWMAEQGLTEWPVSPERPQIVVVIDELGILIGRPGMTAELNELSLKGRQQGISLVGATQLLQASVLGDSVVLRKQASIRACLRVTEKDDGVPVFGHDGVAEGWRPDRLGRHRGLVLIQSNENPYPEGYRSWYLPSDRLPDLVRRALPLRPRLEEETVAGLLLAEPEPARQPTPDERLQELLREAPREGMEFGAIVRAMKPWMSRGTVNTRLKQYGRRIAHGRWRLAGGEGDEE